MDKYGIDNVRGGSYCTLKLSEYDKQKAQQTINSVMDRCYICGMSGHFVNNCNVNNCNVNNYNVNNCNENSKYCDHYYYEGTCNKCCSTCRNTGQFYAGDDYYVECMDCWRGDITFKYTD